MNRDADMIMEYIFGLSSKYHKLATQINTMESLVE